MVLPAYVRVPDERATTGSIRVVHPDGTTRWAHTTERPTYETPRGDRYTTGGGVHGVTLHNGAAIYTTGQSVLARDLDDGSVRWRSFMKEDGFGTGPAAHGDRVVVGSTTGRIFGLDAGDGSEQWRRDVQGGMLVPARFATAPETPSDTLRGAVAYQIDDGYGVLYALNARTGDLRWRESPPENATDADATYRTAPGIGPNMLVIVGSRRIYGLTRKGR
jgi:outer membrane protein assembly factor BamB